MDRHFLGPLRCCGIKLRTLICAVGAIIRRSSGRLSGVLACTLLKRLCQFGVVVNGGGFAASLDEFSRHGAIYFPMWSGAKAEDNARQTPPESP